MSPSLGKLLLVGELNLYSDAPEYALYALPYRASGDRLRRILGLDMDTYHALGRVNLCTGSWSMRAAREHARRIVEAGEHVAIVMLGAKVREAFHHHLPASGLAFFGSASGNPTFVSLPHPSGLNLLWNERSSVRRAREVLLKQAPFVRWGDPADDVVWSGRGP